MVFCASFGPLLLVISPKKFNAYRHLHYPFCLLSFFPTLLISLFPILVSFSCCSDYLFLNSYFLFLIPLFPQFYFFSHIVLFPFFFRVLVSSFPSLTFPSFPCSSSIPSLFHLCPYIFLFPHAFLLYLFFLTDA